MGELDGHNIRYGGRLRQMEQLHGEHNFHAYFRLGPNRECDLPLLSLHPIQHTVLDSWQRHRRHLQLEQHNQEVYTLLHRFCGQLHVEIQRI